MFFCFFTELCKFWWWIITALWNINSFFPKLEAASSTLNLWDVTFPVYSWKRSFLLCSVRRSLSQIDMEMSQRRWRCFRSGVVCFICCCFLFNYLYILWYYQCYPKAKHSSAVVIEGYIKTLFQACEAIHTHSLTLLLHKISTGIWDWASHSSPASHQ